MDLLSEHGYRQDGRTAKQIRNMSCKLSVYGQADGSAYLEQGNTKVLAAVFGPHEPRNRSRTLDDRCTVNCQYSMATFSTNERKWRPRGDRKASEIGSLLQKTFETVLLTRLYPRSQMDIFCEVVQADGGELAACVNAAALALVDGGVPMRGLVSAAAVACARGAATDAPLTPLADSSNAEESGNSARATAAILPRTGEVVLLEMENRLHRDHLDAVMDAAVDACGRAHTCLQYAVQQHVATTLPSFNSLQSI